MFSVLAGLTAVCGPHSVLSQEYPTKTIRLITTGVGGASDFTSRILAQGLSPLLGQPVVVDNRATGVIPGQTVAQAAPDGYTLLVNGSSFWVATLFQKTPYDPIKDFAPITITNRQPNILVVHPSLPVKSVKELIALAKARPGELNYAAGATGSSSQVATELFEAMANIKLNRIPYKASGQEVTDLLGGHVQLSFGTAPTVGSFVKSGRLKALAVTTAEPYALLPNIPTVASSGLPGYVSGSNTGLFAPAKTPPAIVNRLNQEAAKVLRAPEVREKFIYTGSEPVASTPEQLGELVKSELVRLGKLFKTLQNQ